MSHFVRSGLRVLILTAVFMLVGVSIAPAPVEARWPCYDAAPRTCSFIRTYYSDAQRTNQVGSWFWRCSGSSTLEGERTAYYTTEIVEPCPGGGGPV